MDCHRMHGWPVFLCQPMFQGIISQSGVTMSKILIAEDERDIRELVGFALQISGHELIFATNGEEACRLCESNQPDLILLDYRMPVMNGDEAAERIRTIPRLAHIPVVFLTAKEQDPTMAGLIANGAHFIAKPFSIDQLNLVVNNAIKQSAAA
jgi:CheY-like chemotaxis protein